MGRLQSSKLHDPPSILGPLGDLVLIGHCDDWSLGQLVFMYGVPGEDSTRGAPGWLKAKKGTQLPYARDTLCNARI